VTSTPIAPERWYCVAGTGEDPFLWKSSKGLHILFHGMCPSGFLQSHYAFSVDNGSTWTVSQRQTYGYDFAFSDASSHFYARVERPQLIFDPADDVTPLGLANGVCDGGTVGDIYSCLFGQDGMTWTAMRRLQSSHGVRT